jgi:hypothetical protein
MAEREPVARRALVVGVGHYNDQYLKDLPGALYEASNWTRLLTSLYAFEVLTLTDEQATKDDILDGLRWLYRDAGPGSQRIYCHIGHGTVVQKERDRNHGWEQAVVAYCPARARIEDALVRASDIRKVLIDAALPDDIRNTIIADTCWSGRLDIPLPPNVQFAFAPLFTGVEVSTLEADEFGVLPDKETLGSKRPLIVAACGPKEQAAHIDDDGQPRSLFSMRATNYLRTNRPTFADLVEKIKPLLEGLPQTPELRGNVDFVGEVFPGITATEEASTANAATLSSAGTVSVRFTGICCFADPKDPNLFAKRVLLPYDSRQEEDLRHIAFLEVGEDQIQTYDGTLEPIIGPHNGGGIDFLRWEFHGHRIRFTNVDEQASALSYRDGYVQYIPGMKSGICTSLDPLPDDSCYNPLPPAVRVAAHLDLKVGVLDVSDVDPKVVLFMTKSNQISPWIRRMARYVELDLPISAPGGMIEISDATGVVATITLKPYSSVLIGNEREADIVDDSLSVENPREHFHLFYQLARTGTVPSDPPLPWVTAVPQTFCSPTGWP